MSNDIILINRYLQNNNDRKAFDAIYTTYYTMVFTYIFNKVKNKTIAEDLTQECFLKVHKYIYQLNKAEAFKSWIYSIAHNLCLSHFKTIKRETELKNKLSVSDTDSATDETNESFINKELLFNLLDKCLNIISALDRSIILDKYIQNKTYEELKSIYNLSTSALKMRINRVKAKIIEYISPELHEQWA